tara:strand:- start:1184 stop:1312 length:129 start_codon:yes stop_codon:yes gene_type:complete
MKKRRISEAQIVKALKKHESGRDQDSIHQVSTVLNELGKGNE